MSVEQANDIDFLAHDPQTGETLLVMVEARDWISSPITIHQLDTKFAAYTQFVLCGALARIIPEQANNPVRFQLDHFCPISEAAEKKLREWAGKLSWIPISVWSHRMYWNPLLSFFRRISRKFGGPRSELVRWMPK